MGRELKEGEEREGKDSSIREEWEVRGVRKERKGKRKVWDERKGKSVVESRRRRKMERRDKRRGWILWQDAEGKRKV